MDENIIGTKTVFGAIIPQSEVDFSSIYNLALRNCPPSTGDLITFTGIVRDSSIKSDKQVVSLDIEGWEQGSPIMQKIAEEIAEKYNLTLTYLIHLTGSFQIGDALVIVVLGSEHREEAFAALPDIINRYKHEAPVWKKEIYDDGSSKWITTAKPE